MQAHPLFAGFIKAAHERANGNSRTYPDAIDWLYDLRLLGSKLGLDNPRQLASLADDPQEQPNHPRRRHQWQRVRDAESIYRAADNRTGLHLADLVSFRERIQINREHIPKAEVVALVEWLQQPREFLPMLARPFSKLSPSWHWKRLPGTNAMWCCSKPVWAGGWMRPIS